MRMIIAGGGTGGHIFPALAVAEEFLELNKNNQVLLVGAKGGLEEKIFARCGMPFKLIRAGKFSGQSWLKKTKAIFELLAGMMSTFALMIKFHPKAVLGMGGYVSVPVVLTGFVLRIPRAIHEQNSYPGLANRLLGIISNKIFLSFENAKKYFPLAKKEKFILTGNPVRKSVCLKLMEGSAQKEKEKFQILIIGGSQGAKSLNRLVKDALEHLKEKREKIHIVHMTGTSSRQEMEQAYQKAGFSAEVYEFIEDMGEKLRQADLVISRAGAGAIFELALAGVPSILIPYPYATNNHQLSNAKYLEENSASWVFEEKELDGKKLATAIIRLIEDDELRLKMKEQAKKLAKPFAGKIIAQEMMKLAGEG